MGPLPQPARRVRARVARKAAAATDGGAFDDQLVPVSGPDGVLRRRGHPAGNLAEKLAALKPAFLDDGVIHAGNSSQISDGCAALLITTRERAAELGLRPLARFHSGAVTGDDPVTMLTAPIPATAKVLKRAGLTIDDIGVFEVNEAFASVPLAWEAETGADHERLNPLGGAIAVGHPLGASGAILMTRMVHHMRGQRHPLRPADDVRGRRHGQRDRHRTADRLTVTPRPFGKIKIIIPNGRVVTRVPQPSPPCPRPTKENSCTLIPSPR